MSSIPGGLKERKRRPDQPGRQRETLIDREAGSKPFENLAKGRYAVNLIITPRGRMSEPWLSFLAVMPDLDKLFEKAEKNLQKQKFEAAFETYLEIQKYQPNDEQVLLVLGDLSLRMNRAADAVRFQSLLVDQYLKRNDLPKAVAACRKILKSAPRDAATLTKMAGLLERSQKNGDALQAYRDALSVHRAAGASQQALECLQHLAKLEPTNVDTHVELGEMASRLRQVKAAAASFLTAAKLAQQAGEEGRWAELVERTHSLDPQDETAALAVAQLYLKRDRAKQAVTLIEPLARNRGDDLVVLELLATAYLRAGDLEKAEPLCWKLYQARPDAIELVLDMAERLLHSGSQDKAFDIIGKLRGRMVQQGKPDEFLKIVEKIYAADESNLAVLEMLASLYTEANREDGLRRSLDRLLNLYLASEQYDKAADALQKIIDVDPYGEGHQDRLLNLEGHIDPVLYKNILSRLEPESASWKALESQPSAGSAQAEASESLEDLLVEGEMYHQYQLAPKLKQTLETIDRLYPGAQEQNARLRELYETADFTPTPARPVAPGASATQGAPSARSLEEFKQISEITANIYRESTPQGVAQVAVNEIGRALNVARCWGALGSAEGPPTLTFEYCSPAASPSNLTATLKIYATLMKEAGKNADGWRVEDVSRSPLLDPVFMEIQKLGIKALLAMPLIDREQPVGVFIVEQCDKPRAWTAGETVLFKSIVTQVIIAVNNTKLRRLVRSLSGTDEETALLPRNSYLDCLLAEAHRAKELSQPLSVGVLEAANSAALVKALGDAGTQNYFRQVSKTLQAHLRQNDIAVRYSPCSIAVVFPDTALPQGGLAVEKLRGVISQIKPEGVASPAFPAAVCDVPLGSGFDPVDGVTEVINRLEAVLEQAHKETGNRLLLSKFQG
jgi:GAF domain-containing protein/predicted Zn-dependent protease